MTRRPKFKSLAVCMATMGLTQERVAEQMGVDQSHISNILNGRRGVSLEMAFRFQDKLGVEARSFIVPEAEKERNRRGTKN